MILVFPIPESSGATPSLPSGSHDAGRRVGLQVCIVYRHFDGARVAPVLYEDISPLIRFLVTLDDLTWQWVHCPSGVSVSLGFSVWAGKLS